MLLIMSSNLVSSRDIFISTQQSGGGASNSNTNTFSNFKICFNANPLKCSDSQFMRLSITQFNLYRNFYLVNSNNNTILSKIISADGTTTTTASLTPKDYGNISDIASEFSTQILTLLNASQSVGTFSAGTITPNGFAIGSTGTRIFDCIYTLNSHGITTCNLQTPQFGDNFSDSYALLGGKRIGTDDSVATSSFTITIATNTIRVQGLYPLQRSTMPFLYLRCELNGNNLETQNLSNTDQTPSSHILQSSIICKVPVGDEFCSAQFDNLSPYFVDLESNFVSEISFQVRDHHGRKIPDIAGDNTIETEGNLFLDMTSKVLVYEGGQNPNVLNTPVAPYSRFSKNNENIMLMNNNPYKTNPLV